MNEAQVEERLKQIVRPYVKNEELLKNITRESTMTADLDIDSMRLVDIVIAVEDEFKIRIEDEDVTRVKNFGDTISLITQKISKAENA